MTDKFTAVFEQVGEWWIGHVEELPGANTQGKTLEEACDNLKKVVQLIIEADQIPWGRRRANWQFAPPSPTC
ncbi:MAG: type II toxin-antitoxin system HicB family antitoxin [Chloroflexota bacterium]|nr:type II toxin-antitoxin system HicB family antitoxin [Chloroflexota bacterium]